MKTFPFTFIVACGIVGVGFCGGLMGYSFAKMDVAASNKPRIDLPEEYRLIRNTDHLRGAYDSVSNTVTIEFDNSQNNSK